MKAVDVSIIIPTCNRPYYITKAIDSCLAQIGVNVEIIVVDDNGKGTDNQLQTASVLNEYIINNKIKYIVHEVSKNGSAARNTGISAAKGKYVAFLDDDDWFEKDKLFKQIQSMSHDNSKACLCGFRRVYQNNSVESVPSHISIDATEVLAFEIDTCAGSALIIEKELCLQINGFDETFIRHQDIEFLYRVLKYTKISINHNILVNIKMHSGNSKVRPGNQVRDFRLHFLKVFEEDICKLDISKQKRIFNKHYHDIAKAYLKNYKLMSTLFWLMKTSNPLKYSVITIKDAFIFSNNSIAHKPQSASKENSENRA